MWLADVNHLTKTETGIVFSSISLFAIIFQPVFGLMSDKLGLRKHLLWTITVLLIPVRTVLYFRFFTAAANEYYRRGAGGRDLSGDCFLQRLRGGGSLYRARQPGQPL
ncbi:MFS transporter [Klebsiella variicola subsp. variicola]|nr:MFS transporter [Klebsiella variicola subsp. variicola]